MSSQCIKGEWGTADQQMSWTRTPRFLHSPMLWDNSQAPIATQTNNNDATKITTYLLSRYIARTLTDRIQQLCTVMTGTFQLVAHRRNIISPTTWIPTAVIAPSYRTKCSHLCTCHNALKLRMDVLLLRFSLDCLHQKKQKLLTVNNQDGRLYASW